MIEQLDVVVGGDRIQLDKAQQHVTIVTAGIVLLCGVVFVKEWVET